MARTFESVDPAPALAETDIRSLSARLMDGRLRMFERFRALFALRALGTPAAIDAMALALLDDKSALLRHEVAFTFGQLRDPHSVKYLVRSIEHDESAMVRHEACEALGAIATAECVPVLERTMIEDPAIEVRESCQVALDNIHYLKDRATLD